MQNELKQQLNHLQDDFQLKIDELINKLEIERLSRENLENKRQALIERISKLESAHSRPSAQLYSTSSNIVEEDGYSTLRNIPPASCLDLQRLGHYLDGIYMVANKETTKIEAYFCDFGTTRKIVKKKI